MIEENKLEKIKEVLYKFSKLNANLASETTRDIIALEIYESIKKPVYKIRAVKSGIKTFKPKNNKSIQKIKFDGNRR